jgi:hypothetical protein
VTAAASCLVFSAGLLTEGLTAGRNPGPLINVSPQDNGHAFSWYANVANMLVNASLPYAGGLTIIGVPRGSVWSITQGVKLGGLNAKGVGRRAGGRPGSTQDSGCGCAR